MKARGFGGLLDAMGGHSKEARGKFYNENRLIILPHSHQLQDGDQEFCGLS